MVSHRIGRSSLLFFRTNPTGSFFLGRKKSPSVRAREAAALPHGSKTRKWGGEASCLAMPQICDRKGAGSRAHVPVPVGLRRLMLGMSSPVG